MTFQDPPWKARPGGSDYDVVRQRIVDAVEDLIREGGLASLRQDAVAERAGLHRSSVYRYFDSKEEMVTAAVVQSTLRIGRRVQGRIGEVAPPERLVVGGIIEALEEMADDPLHRALAAPGSSRTMTRLANNALREGIRPLLETVFDGASGRDILRDGVSTDDAIRWLQVVTVGLMYSPNVVRDADDLEAMLTLMLIPALIEIEPRHDAVTGGDRARAGPT